MVIATPLPQPAMSIGLPNNGMGADGGVPMQSGASPAPTLSAAVSAAFIAAAARLDALRDELLENARHEMVELALQVARSVIGDHVSRADVDLQPVLGNALSQIAEGIQATVRIHPSSRHMVEAWMVQGVGRSVRIVADASLHMGDVVVESDGGSVDGRLQTRLDRAEEEVRRALGG